MSTAPSPLQRLGPYILATVVGLEFLYLSPALARLFWLADEFSLIDQIDDIGFVAWLWISFAENFCPLFKLLWGGLVVLGHGSYFLMLAVVWGTHALNTALLAIWMRWCGIGFASTMFCGLIFGLSGANLETLTWSVQWSAMLAVTWFLIAGIAYSSLASRNLAPSNARLIGFGLLSLASAWSFSRGVLTGAVLAALAGMRTGSIGGSAARRAVFTAACLLPSLVTAGLIFKLSPGTHHDLFGDSGHVLKALAYAIWYLALNPFVMFLDLTWWSRVHWPVVFALGALKIAINVTAWRMASLNQRRLLQCVLLLDLGNAVLLAVGRYGEGLKSAMSSRYQYCALIAFLPFLAIVVAAVFERFRTRKISWAIPATAMLLVVIYCNRNWVTQLPQWVQWRGAFARQVLFEPVPTRDAKLELRVFSLETNRARELVEKYHLH